MAATRATTGNSRPRLFPIPETTTTTRKPMPKRKTAAGAKANTTRKRTANTTTTGAVKSGRVTKKTTAGETHKRKTTIKDKVKGVGKKIDGALTNRPAKKAAGTKKIRGTDGKGSHAKTVVR